MLRGYALSKNPRLEEMLWDNQLYHLINYQEKTRGGTSILKGVKGISKNCYV